MIPRLAICVAFFTALAIPSRASGVSTEQGALALALIAALTLSALEPAVRQRIRNAVFSLQGAAVGLVFCAWAITVYFSFDPLISLKISGRTAMFVLGAVVVWAALSEHSETWRLALKTIVVSAIVFAVLALISLVGVPKIASLVKGTLSAPDRPIVVFKAFAASAMCLIPVVAWAGRRLEGNWRWWGYAFAPMALGVMLLTYNRSSLAGLIAMTLAGIFLLTLAKRRHVKAMITVAIAATGSAVAWVALREVHDLDTLEQRIGAPLNVQTYLPSWLLDSHRQNIWKFAYERFLDHPWVGNGIDQLNRLPGAKISVPGLENSAAYVPSHPHNWALELLSETGLIGFLPVVAVLTLIAWKLVKSYIQTDDEADITLFTLMAGFWGSALFNFSIWAAWWQLTFLILFAIVAASRSRT